MPESINLWSTRLGGRLCSVHMVGGSLRFVINRILMNYQNYLIKFWFDLGIGLTKVQNFNS